MFLRALINVEAKAAIPLKVPETFHIRGAWSPNPICEDWENLFADV